MLYFRSLGVTTYVLLTGFSPFGGETDQETFQNISLGEVDFPEEIFEDVSAQAKDFVAKLLVLDPRYNCYATLSTSHFIELIIPEIRKYRKGCQFWKRNLSQ